MRLKHYFPPLCFICVCLLAACTAEEPPFATPSGGEATFTFALNTGTSLSAATRVVSDTELADVWVVQLNPAGTAALSAPSHVTPDGSKKIKAKLAKEQSKVYFFANTGDANLFDPDAALSTFTTATVEAAGMTYNSDWADKSYIPMFGTWTGTPTVPTIADEVELTRAFAILKIRVSRVQPAAAKLSFESLQLKNVPNVLRLCPSTDATYPAATGTYVNYPPITNTTAMYNYDTFTFYVPENHRGTGSGRFETEKTASAVTNGAYATCYEIKGKYGIDPITYRFYLGANNKNDYNIDRNYMYTMNIVLSGANPLDARIELSRTSLSVGSGTGVDWGTGESWEYDAFK